MIKKQFDSQTAKKIINEYAEKINLLSRENQSLKKQLEDAKISLQINKDILYQHIKSKKNVSDECQSVISDLKKENERLNEKIAFLFKEKGELSKKIYLLQDTLNDKLTKDSVITENSKTKIFLYENSIKEKDCQILNLKKEIEALQKNIINLTKGGEANLPMIVYIGEPNRTNTELTNELKITKNLIKDYIYLLQEERNRYKKLQKEIDFLKNQKNSISTNTSFIGNNRTGNTSKFSLLNEIFLENNNKDNDSLSLSLESSQDEKIDLSIVKNKNIKKRTKTCEKINLNRIPKLDIKKAMENNDDKKNDNQNIEQFKEGSDLLIQKYKSQIQTYQNIMGTQKKKINELKIKNRELRSNNSLLVKTLSFYMDNKDSNKNKNIKQNNNDISMNPNVNDASGLSTNSIIYKGGALENINKLSELNKISRLNKYNNNINIIENNINLENIVIKDNILKPGSKEIDKITTNGSSKFS